MPEHEPYLCIGTTIYWEDNLFPSEINGDVVVNIVQDKRCKTGIRYVLENEWGVIYEITLIQLTKKRYRGDSPFYLSTNYINQFNFKNDLEKLLHE